MLFVATVPHHDTKYRFVRTSLSLTKNLLSTLSSSSSSSPFFFDRCNNGDGYAVSRWNTVSSAKNHQTENVFRTTTTSNRTPATTTITTTTTTTARFGRQPRQHQQQNIQHFPKAYFGTSTKDDHDNDKKNNNNSILQHHEIQTIGKGFGQVIFVDSVKGGGIIAASLLIGCNGDPLLPLLAVVGTVVSHGTAHVTGLKATTKSLYDTGLYGYNGCLIGCASAVFLPTIPSAIFGTLVGAATTPLVQITLSKTFQQSGMPQWTYAFNFVMLTALLRTQPFKVVATTTIPETTTTTDVVTTTTTAAVVEPVAASSSSLFDILITGPLAGISQIYVVESWLGGAGILYGISVYSPMLAYYALSGSVLGTLTGYTIYGVPAPDCIAGLWGYNSALTAMSIGVFFQTTRESKYYLLPTASIATAAIFGTCQSIFGATFNAPCLTLPFCLAASATWMIGKANVLPGIQLVESPHSPEKNI